jgi:hypothetical protein
MLLSMCNIKKLHKSALEIARICRYNCLEPSLPSARDLVDILKKFKMAFNLLVSLQIAARLLGPDVGNGSIDHAVKESNSN